MLLLFMEDDCLNHWALQTPIQTYTCRPGGVPYKKDGGVRRKCWKEPLRGIKIRFCGRSLKYFSSLRGTNSHITHYLLSYYMEKSVLLGTKPLVDSIRHLIRDPSGVFSVCHLCECRIVQWSHDSRLLLLLNWFLHMIKRTLHVGEKIWILRSRGKIHIFSPPCNILCIFLAQYHKRYRKSSRYGPFETKHPKRYQNSVFDLYKARRAPPSFLYVSPPPPPGPDAGTCCRRIVCCQNWIFIRGAHIT